MANSLAEWLWTRTVTDLLAKPALLRQLWLRPLLLRPGFSLALLVEGLLAYTVGRWIDRGHERAVMSGGSALAAISTATVVVTLVVVMLLERLIGLEFFVAHDPA